MQTKQPATGGQVERVVRPVAEVKSARLRWHLPTPDADPVAKFLDDQTHPLYDQDALDAEVAAERERCAKLCEEMFSFGALEIADAIRRA